ncbi:MAG: DUF3179 domain-containing (seleno)protein [Bacteroidota bacterium]
MTNRTLSLICWTGIFLLIIPGLVYAYLLMPFPGSQDLEAISVVYYLEKWVLPLRIVGVLLIIGPFWKTFTQGSLTDKLIKGMKGIICLALFYYTDIEYKAEAMFEEPQLVHFAESIHNKVPDSLLVIGVVHEGKAKAYPVNYLGYHHKVQDKVGTLPILVTYCTMCRTGRVFSPIINGKPQKFRLVGARHYNAVIEDESTKSWWYQATGEAAVGALKGHRLAEVPYEQLTLRSWLEKYPTTLILQPDTHYLEAYNDLKRYDRQQAVDRDSTLKVDTLVRKSWIVGITVAGKSKAYDWKQLAKIGLVNDQVNLTPVLIGLEKDKQSFHAFNRKVDGKALEFTLDSTNTGLLDKESGSHWNWQGECVEGIAKGKKLVRIQAHQEYWHSWQRFHAPTLLWRGNL